jgi:hypothetical protein
MTGSEILRHIAFAVIVTIRCDWTRGTKSIAEEEISKLHHDTVYQSPLIQNPLFTVHVSIPISRAIILKFSPLKNTMR